MSQAQCRAVYGVDDIRNKNILSPLVVLRAMLEPFSWKQLVERGVPTAPAASLSNADSAWIGPRTP
jgi:hypothetical protein